MLPGEAELIEALFEEGLQILHLRKPGRSLSEVRSLISSIPKKHHRKIVIHGHYRLAGEFGLKGIHLTEKSRKRSLPLSFNKKKHTLSASFHSITGILKTTRKYNYVFLSPIYNSISKKGYKSHFKEEELRQLLKEEKNIVALGGITPAVIAAIRKLGFAGAATLGHIWESKDPLGSYKELASKIK